MECKLVGEKDGIKRGIGNKFHQYWKESNQFEMDEKTWLRPMEV